VVLSKLIGGTENEAEGGPNIIDPCWNDSDPQHMDAQKIAAD